MSFVAVAIAGLLGILVGLVLGVAEGSGREPPPPVVLTICPAAPNWTPPAWPNARLVAL